MPDYGRGKRPLDKPSRQEERLRRDRDAVQRALDRFSDVKVRTLIERGERGVRGSREGESVGAPKGEAPDPTSGVALEGLPSAESEASDVWRERADAVGRCIKDIAALLDHAKVTMESAEDKLVWVLNLKPDEALPGHHKTAASCRACDRTVTGSAEDRLRAGYCDACRKAWARELARWTDERRPGAPDRLAFERQRRALADAERREAS